MIIEVCAVVDRDLVVGGQQILQHVDGRYMVTLALLEQVSIARRLCAAAGFAHCDCLP
jgi:hypothetical protein